MILRQNVAFDLDGTLVDLMSLFKRVIRDVAGVGLAEMRDSFKIVTDPPVDNSVIWEAFRIAYKRVNDIPAIPGAVELLKELYITSQGEPVTIITDRPHWSANDTYRLLDRLLDGIPYRLIMVQNGEQKLPYLLGIDHFVDDRRKTAKQMVEGGKWVFVPKTHYNLMDPVPDGIQYIDSVADLIPMVCELLKTDVRYA